MTESTSSIKNLSKKMYQKNVSCTIISENYMVYMINQIIFKKVVWNKCIIHEKFI